MRRPMTGRAAGVSDQFDLRDARIWVAGHKGMVGSAIVRRLAAEGAGVLTATREEADLTNQASTDRWVKENKPDLVFLAAAKVGGIVANNTAPVEFLYENMMIEMNIIRSSFEHGVRKLVFLGSSCIYPRLAPQPIPEEALLTGPLEPTNEWYAIAKIAGLKLCAAYHRQYGADFVSAMPTNLYGPNDNFDLEKSHVIAALMRKIHEARRDGRDEVVVWGTGTPRREFLHVDDCADACVFIARNYSDEPHVNVGTGEDLSIAELAELLREVIGWKGQFVYDTSRPDGTPRKVMDVSRLTALGWSPKIELREGLAQAYSWYGSNAAEARN